MNSDLDWAPRPAVPAGPRQAVGQALQSPSAGRRAAGLSLPELSFSARQAAGLQAAYLREAAELWNRGPTARPPAPTSASPRTPGRATRSRLSRRSLPAQRAHAAGPGRGGRHRRQDQGPACASRWSSGWPPRRRATSWRSTPRRSARRWRPRARASPGPAEPAGRTSSRATCRMTDESVFEVGRNVATTEGAVVFENDLFQLIEYKPLTGQGVRAAVPGRAAVHQQVLHPRPAAGELADPLPGGAGPSHLRGQLAQPGRVDGGQDLGRLHRGRRAQGDRGGAGDHRRQADQRAGLLRGRHDPGHRAGRAGRAQARSRWPRPPCSPRFLDFSDTGVLDLFIDEAIVQMREMPMGEPGGGLLKGQELASTFSFLRPERPGLELRGRQLPQGRDAAAVRPALLEQRLHQPARARCTPGTCATPTSRTTWSSRARSRSAARRSTSRKVDVPVYIYGSREDHIVPMAGAYATPQHLKGKKRFVLGASGHIAGVINPPAKNKRSYWTNDKLPKTPRRLAGRRQGAPRQLVDRLGDLAQGPCGQAGCRAQGLRQGKYKAIEPAPGRYVKAKA